LSSLPRPPRLARWLLGLLLPRTVEESFAGDLEEKFHREAAVDLKRARRIYWKDVLSPTVLHLRREVKGMHLTPGSRPGTLRGDGMISGLLTDLKFAVRMLLKAPAFTAVAVFSLALGIGPNTAIFSLVNAVLFQEWGVRDPDTLVDVYGIVDGRHFFTDYGVYELVMDGSGDVFEDVAGHGLIQANIEQDGQAQLVLGEMVSGNYFDVMGVPAARGRTFLPEEDATPGTHSVVVLSDRYWRSRYGADPALIGGEIRMNGRPYTVVGIAPATYKGRIAPGIGTDFWVPTNTYPHLNPGQKGSGNFIITGRVKPGVPAARAVPAVEAIAARYNADHPERRRELQLGAVVLGDILLHPDMDRTIGAMAMLLFAAVGMVLLIACVNLAGFLMARATDRRKEMSVRIALGAKRRDIVQQLLVEAFVLAGMGGAAGLALGQLLLRSLLSVKLPVPMPVTLQVGLDGRLLLFTGGVSVVAALLFGLTPALESMRAPVASTLRDESGSSGGTRKARARQFLVAAQMAVCTVLLFGSGLFVRSLQNAASRDVGFSTAPAAVVTAETWANQYTDEQQQAFIESVVRQVSESPGVTGVAATRRLPLDLGTVNVSVDVPGVEPPSDQDHWRLEYAGITPGYFDVMDIPLVEGRDFDSGDTRDGQPVAIISQAAAQRFWPGESAVGKVIFLGAQDQLETLVVGVADNVKIWSLTEAPRPYFYLPFNQREGYGMYHLVARGSAPAAELAGRVRDAAKAFDPDIVLSDVGTMDDHLGYIFFLPRMAAVMLSLVGLMALVLASVGLYGMVSYAAARRTREMGIRLALGADAGRVVGLVVRGGLGVVAVGGVVGLGASMFLGSVVQRFLYDVGSLDPVALLAAPALLGAVALLATWLPARRVSRVDPVNALRSE
jgi:predicted permease